MTVPDKPDFVDELLVAVCGRKAAAKIDTARTLILEAMALSEAVANRDRFGWYADRVTKQQRELRKIVGTLAEFSEVIE